MKTQMMVIAMMGVSMLVVGLVIYAMADQLSGIARLLSPLAPISVAAYIYVNNLMQNAGPDALRGPALLKTIDEVFRQVLVGGILFIVIAFLMLGSLIIWQMGSPSSG